MSLIQYENRFILFNIGHGSFDDGITIWFAFRLLGIGLELDFTTRTYFVKPKPWRIVVGNFYDSYGNQYLWNSLRVFRTKHNGKLDKEA